MVDPNGRHEVTEAERIGFVDDAHARHGGLVQAVVSRTVPRAWRDDVIQNVWMKVFRYAHTYDAERGAVATWLALIARRESQNYLRNQLRSVPESLLQDHPATTADEPIEDAELLDEVLAQLPAHEAETLRLVARGLTFDEVAKLQNEPRRPSTGASAIA
jgi:RNA polymerase sigma factor (sigma-70 family)